MMRNCISRPSAHLLLSSSLGGPEVPECTSRLFVPDSAIGKSLSFTVKMEWVAPSNRIALGCANTEPTVLNICSNMDGSYLDHDMLVEYRDYAAISRR